METKTKLKLEPFKQKIGSSWWRHVQPLFLSGEMDGVFGHLKEQSKKGFTITPASANTFRAFQLCKYEDLKLVIVCEKPYHTLREDVIVADGLALSANHPNVTYFPPLLDHFYDGLEKDLYDGLCLDCVRCNDLGDVAKQGVLFLNASLTTEAGNKDNPHRELWEAFTGKILEAVGLTSVPVIFLGENTWHLEKYLSPFEERFFLPSPGKDWDTQRAFAKALKIIKDNTGEEVSLLYQLPF